MPNTSVHFPDGILDKLDRIAAARRVSRNRLIVEACQRSLEEHRSWPPDLFDRDRLSEEDLAELRAGRDDFERALRDSRRSRGGAPF